MGHNSTLLCLLLSFCLAANAQSKADKPTTGKNIISEKSQANGNDASGKSKTQADNISGIWKGYFVQSSFGFSEDKYRFEVQLEKLSNNALRGVTYSYKTTVFYGKAEATGIYTKKTENVLLKELKMVDLKMTEPNNSACLMTCYLEYSKMGNVETLTGTYTSVSINDKKDCGSGKVYLEKTTTSDFYKEDFILKKENEARNKAKIPAKPAPGSKTTSGTSITKVAPKKGMKPGAEKELIPETKITNAPNNKSAEPVTKVAEPVKPTSTITQKNETKPLPKPEVVKSRDNELAKTITTSEKTIKIDLYDNGEIDGDRISVYHNNKLVVSNQLLTNKPISFSFEADENDPVHEFVMVAENLGSIPPNTSLMIITAGEKRYELFLTSTEQKNAVVKIVYQPE